MLARLCMQVLLCCGGQYGESQLDMFTKQGRMCQPDLRISCPAHGRIINAIDVAIRGWLIISVCHALDVVIPIEVLERVLQASTQL